MTVNLRTQLVALVVGIVVFAMPTAARAGAAAKLTYVRGAGATRCPDEAALREAVAARVGYDLFFPWAQKAVVVEVSRAKPSGYHGLIQIVDGGGVVVGQRELNSKGDDCVDLVRALALAISIAVDDHTLEYIPPPPDPPPAASAQPRADPDARPSPSLPLEPEKPSSYPATAVPVKTPLRWLGWVAPLVDVGSAPSPAWGGEVNLAARYGRFSLEIGVRGDVPASVASHGGSLTTWLVVATIAPCIYSFSTFSLCALAEAGWFEAEGTVAPARRDGEAFASAGARIKLEWPLAGKFFMMTHADGVLALTRFDVQVDGAPAYTVPLGSLALAVGLGASF